MIDADIKYKKEGNIGVINFFCNKKYNIFTIEILFKFEKIINKILKDKSVKVIIIEGDDRSFLTGFNINSFKEYPRSEIRKCFIKTVKIFDSMENSSKIFISSISGFCFGGGFEVALATDYIIASKSAKFGLPEIKLGMLPGVDGLRRLVREVGKKKAMEYILTGKILSVKEAYRLNIVNEIVSVRKLKKRSREFANELLSKNPLAIESIKILSQKALSENISIEELSRCAKCLDTDESQNAINTFLNKNKKK